MDIEYITGNLLDTPHKIILHGCNGQGAMRSGVAKAIRNKYPNAYLVYRAAYANVGLTLGSIFVADCDDKSIVNGITQKYYGRDGKRYVDYDAINTVSESTNLLAADMGETHVAMPLIGAGLGGGSWKKISEIIEAQCVDVTPVVYTLDGLIPEN